MKRADLEVGKAYYYARTNDWQEYLGQGSKVVIVDTGCWEQPHTWARNLAPRKATKGTGVLVDQTVRTMYGNGEEKIVRKVVTLASLRGPYEETLKLVEENQKRRAEQYKITNERQEQKRIEIKTAVDLAKENGVVVGHGGEISISAAELTRLVNAARGNVS